MDMGNPQAAFDAFTSAIAHDPKDPDIYYPSWPRFVLLYHGVRSKDTNLTRRAH